MCSCSLFHANQFPFCRFSFQILFLRTSKNHGGPVKFVGISSPALNSGIKWFKEARDRVMAKALERLPYSRMMWKKRSCCQYWGLWKGMSKGQELVRWWLYSLLLEHAWSLSSSSVQASTLTILTLLVHAGLFWHFHNPPNSDMDNIYIFNMCYLFVCIYIYTHGGPQFTVSSGRFL